MKRKIVQHGPCTLTVSLPIEWLRNYALKKGDDIYIRHMRDGLFLSAGKELHYGQRRVDVRGMKVITKKAVAALYKAGYDEIIVEYSGPKELELIHEIISANFIGFEIVDEKENEVWLKKVSEPSQDEFKTLFRRIFYFLLSTASEGLEAVKQKDIPTFQRMVLRDNNVNRLADFCRRVINKRGQNMYQQDNAIYHIVEQLEKIGDVYKEINLHLYEKEGKCAKQTIALYELTNQFLKMFEELFFNFTLQKVDQFLLAYDDVHRKLQKANEDMPLVNFFDHIVRELYDLSGATMIIHL